MAQPRPAGDTPKHRAACVFNGGAASPLDFAVLFDTNAVWLARCGAMDRWQDEFWCRVKEALAGLAARVLNVGELVKAPETFARRAPLAPP